MLLAESFGREAWQLWAARDALEPAPRRPAVSRGITVAAVVVVWLALVVPDDLSELTPARFARIPLEGLVLVALALVLPPRGRRTAAVVFGVALGLVVVVKALDMGFYAVLDRPFEPLSDYSYFGPGLGVLGDSIGGAGAIAVAVGAALLVVGVLALMPLAAVRVADLVARHRPASVRPVLAVGIVWVLCAVAGLQVASTSAAARVDDLVGQVSDDLADRDVFAREIKDDDFADTPDDQLLTALRGKDVLLVFVESYGRVAVQDSAFSPADHRAARRGHRPAARGRLLLAERLPHLSDVRRGELAGPRQPAVRAVGRQRAALRPAARRGPADPDRRVRRARAGAPSSTYRPTPRTGPRARRSTATTRSTTPATSATRAPSSGTRRCPTSTPSPSSGAGS